ncbi:MAG: aminotransferase class I/II-fold pyridoxal phosphate-dependent enzyme [Rhodobacterales bacterium]|nr:aminotransferase class I/II-fold pyridoxal phosphate-dependent enzyme [Rhodobacterales bacterium]
MSRTQPWRRRLDAIQSVGRTRVLRTVTPTGPVTGVVDGQDVLLACSNDYLGLAWAPTVRHAAQGGGAGGSRLISGSRPIHQALEMHLEELFGRPALLFPSGYSANLAVFSTVCEAGDLLVSDALNHASIIDGIRLSKAHRQVVPHAEPHQIPQGARLVAVEGLFSMDGDTPVFADYPKTPWLAVDEAHAVGCLGPNGTGVAAAQGVQPDILIGTFGKAYGASGAFVVGSQDLKELLINAGRSFIYTTALPDPIAAMALAGVHAATDALREKLSLNATRLRDGLHTNGWSVLGQHHIIPVVVGPSAMDLSQRLLQQGILAPGIRYPTVPIGQERIRFTVSAEHTEADIDQIIAAMDSPNSS